MKECKDQEKLEGNYLVEKSNQLIMSEISRYDAPMLKLLDIYLSKINARDPSTIEVIFTKQELCKIMGIHPKSDISVFEEAGKKLTTTLIQFHDRRQKNNGVESQMGALFGLFEAFIDNGQRKFKIAANPYFMWVFFNLQISGYTSYPVENTLSLKSKQSILLYQNLRMWLSISHRKTMQKEYMMDDLRMMLGVMSLYEEKKELMWMLNRCINEINGKTDMDVSMQTIKSGKTVIGVSFTATRKLAEGKQDVIDVPDETSANDTEDTLAPSGTLDNDGLIFEL